MNVFKRIIEFLRKTQNDNDSKVTLMLCVGNREIVGDEYDTLAGYNRSIQSTEFGSLLFYQLLDKYGHFLRVRGRKDGIEYAYDFGNEKNLNNFVEECERYLN